MTRSISFFCASLAVLLVVVLIAFAPPAFTQDTPDPSGEIVLEEAAPTDTAIAQRIETIFGQIETLANVEASVTAGVVTLTGETLTAEAAERALALAGRVQGVVAVENRIERDVSVNTRIAPAVGALEARLEGMVRIAPLIALAVAVFVALALLGWLLSRWKGLWRAITSNRFIADLLGGAVFALLLVLALVAALSLLDAAAFLGALLGAAGVIGLAIGFAVRDTIENYVASVMLSVRQPFRPNDYVVIDGHEGRVIRLTSRATILMTPKGNHLRIPNAAVFKAVILNYTRNPERGLEFSIGLDPGEAPLAAIEIGLARLRGLDFILAEPDPTGLIKGFGASTIDLVFTAWIDQRTAGFLKSRSAAIAAVKGALDEAGFAMPDPRYRVHLEGAVPSGMPTEAALQAIPSRPAHSEIHPDVAPDTAIARRVAEERREGDAPDLLSEQAPTE